MPSRRWCYEFLVLLICSFVISVHSDIYEACKNMPKHSFIGSNTSCRHFIYCADVESYEGECEDGDYFNELLQTCDPKHFVICKLDNSNNSSSIHTAPTQAATTTTASNSSFSSTTIASSEVPILSSSAPMSTTKINSQTDSNNKGTTSAIGGPITSTTAPSVTNGDMAILISTECPSMDNRHQMIFVPHPKSCSDYSICYHGEKMAMHCSSMLHFNANTGKCDYPENVRCRTGFSNPRELCQLHTVDLYPHNTNCNYFYYCRNGYLLLQQCPVNYGWDFERRACTTLQQATCYNKIIMQ